MNRIKILGDILLKELSEFHIITEVNEHGYAFFTGIISKETSQEIIKKNICEVMIYYEDGVKNKIDRITLFAGQILKYTVKREGDIYYINAECVSASIEFDKEKKCRSFQDIKMTYGQLFRQMAGRGQAILATKVGSIEISHPLIQYEETDWEFLKRMAGQEKTVVIPDICHMYPQIAIGMVKGKTYEMCEQDGCEIKKLQNGSGSMAYAFSLKIKGVWDMNLCDKVLYNGIRLVILKKEVHLLNGMLCCSCWIGKEQLKIIGKHFNKDFCGLRLAGVVEAIVGEKIKIKLNIDDANKEQELYPYTYLPITGNGMYAMPEIGSTAYLHFPDNNEKNAFVIDGLTSRNAARLDSNYKYLKVQEKVLGLLPTELSMKAGSNSMTIFDKNGIEFSSRKKIQISAKNNLIIKNAGIACLRSEESVHIEHNNRNNDYIHIEGVECIIKTAQFLTSDEARKVQQTKQNDPRMTWRAAEIAKNMVPKVLGGIPTSKLEGIGGKVLGGIPGYGKSIIDVDVSELVGIRSERKN